MSRMKFGRLAVLGFCFLIAACATGYAPTPYWTIQDTAFKFLTPGVTTKEEVRQRIGVPLTESHFSRLNEEVWEYRYLEGSTIVMLAYVHFDQNGTYTHIYQILDPAWRGGRHR